MAWIIEVPIKCSTVKKKVDSLSSLAWCVFHILIALWFALGIWMLIPPGQVSMLLPDEGMQRITVQHIYWVSALLGVVLIAVSIWNTWMLHPFKFECIKEKP